MLIKMVDGGLVNYEDDSYSYGGCPTCNYGSEYITEIDLTLTKYKVHIRTNKMYEYVISEGDMMKIFLSNYEEITTLTEKEFLDWFKIQIMKLADEDEIEAYKIIELE
jgi:hypothetical protein